jgi:hypothetical protein
MAQPAPDKLPCDRITGDRRMLACLRFQLFLYQVTVNHVDGVHIFAPRLR